MKPAIFSRSLVIFSTLLLLGYDRSAAQVQLVKDINTSTGSSCGSEPLYERAIVNNIMYFSASDAANGEELWRSDGTLSGTWMVKDIYPGSSSSSPASFTDVNGLLFFIANDGPDGPELWRSDGTSIGTYMVKDIYPGDNGSNPGNIINLNGTLLFSADDGTNGNELWKSDGTSAGTVLVKDIYTGATASGIYNAAALNGYVYFRADDGINGSELWKSDGTTAGTVLVKDINTGAAASYPNGLVVMNGIVYFSADNGTNGQELWRSNGTTAGTYLVKDIFPGASASSIYYMKNVNNTLFFRAESATNDAELWKSDGTTAGTVLVKDIYAGATGSYPSEFANVNGLLYFRATSVGFGTELWVSDGTTLGTGMVKDIETGASGSSPMFCTALGNLLIFQAYSSAYGQEIWRSDGTAGGTFILKDIEPGLASSYPENMFAYNGSVYFRDVDPVVDAEMWKTDGTTSGTVLFMNICPDVGSISYYYPSATQLIDVNGTLFFIGNDGTNGFELWKSNGTTAGTVMVKDIRAGSASSNIVQMVNVNGTLFFNADDGVNGDELWKSDGTTAGTQLVKDIYTGAIGASPGSLTAFQGLLFFNASNTTNGSELWKSDGTSAGTVMVKDICTGGNSSYPMSLYNHNNTLLFFDATEGVNGQELWKSDGTDPGTVLVKDIRPGNSSVPDNFISLNSTTVIFRAMDDTYGTELWRSDGTAAGTVLLKDIRTGINGGITPNNFNMVNVNGTVYFTANDGVNGLEIWKTDGTTGGTVMIKDIFPGSAPMYEYNAYITKIGNTIFFQANDGVNGSELWKSDGTSGGTVMIKDIYGGNKNSLPVNLVNFNDTAFFTADNGVNGYELWTSTGVAAKTSLVSDILPGAGSSTPEKFVKSGTNLFFLADNGTVGKELWKFKTPSPLQTSNAVTNVTCNGLSNGSINVTVAGGTQPYTYSWSNSATTEDISGLAAGTYTLTTTDALGWITTNTFSVTQPAVLNATLTTLTNVSCFNGSNGSINITVTGGTTPFTFAWSNAATTEDVTGLAAGSYSVLITDSKGCTKNFSATITQPLAVSAFTNVMDASCNGGTNGLANVTVVMGVAPYSFLWSANAGSQTTQSAVGLAAGTYTVQVTDANTCTGVFTASLTQPAAYTASVAITHVNCYGASNGSADLTVSGSTPPYTYSWTNGATTQDLSNVMAGNYTVTVTDSKGCTTSRSASITQPPILNPNFSHTDVTCYGLCNGTATVSPTGGTPPYIYSWQTIPVQTTPAATGLCAGNLNITITDNKGCVNVPGISIVQPAVLTVSVSNTGVTCSNTDGTATATPAGGTSPFTYAWTGGGTTQTLSGLAIGNYSVTVTDSKGCTALSTTTVSATTIVRDICIVTVDSTSTKNVVVWEKPAVTNIDSFLIYRDINSVYTKIGSVDFGALSEFTDNTANVNPNNTSYRYKIAALDNCGGKSALSAFHKTIHLQVSLGSPSGYQLNWDDYLGFPVTQYRILRDTNNLGNWVAMDSVPFGITSRTDPTPWDSVRYMIEIDHPSGCVISSKNPDPMATNLNTSRSNVYRMNGNVTHTDTFSDNLFSFVYPNPNNGVFTAGINNSNSNLISVRIFNMLGEEVKRIDLAGRNKITVDLSKEAKGLYNVQLLTDDRIISKKIVIE